MQGRLGDHVDIFHPFAKVEWRKVGTPVPHIHYITPHCVCLNDRFYIVVSEPGPPNAILYSFSLDFKEYKRLSLPVRSFALSHYHSQLVLVGKYDVDDDPSDLWVCADDGVTWEHSLPPLRVRRADVSVVNTGSPEHLVVVGGKNRQYDPMDTVEILIDKEWFIAEHLPYRFEFPRSYVHNGMLIVVSKSQYHSYCCSVASLLETCHKSLEERKDCQKSLDIKEKDCSEEEQPFSLSTPHDNTMSRNEEKERFSLWKEFPKTEKFDSMISFQQKLLAFHRDIVEMFCPFTHSWLRIGVICQPPHYLRGWNGFNTVACTVLTNGEVVLMGELGDLVVCSASLSICPESDLSVSALHKLNVAGFQLNSTLADLYWEFIEAIGLPDVRDETSTEKTMANVFENWLSKKEKVRRPPTWKSLLDILTELGLGELSQQINSYLSNGVMSLREQSMGVIISALLQQGMELDKLSSRFPYYLPTSLRNSILASFKACTLQLVPFTSLPYRPSYCSSGEDSVPSHSTSNSTFISTVLPQYQNPFLWQGGGCEVDSGSELGLNLSIPTSSPFVFGLGGDLEQSPPTTTSSPSIGQGLVVGLASKPSPPSSQGLNLGFAELIPTPPPLFSLASQGLGLESNTFPELNPRQADFTAPSSTKESGLMGLGSNSLAVPTLTVHSSRLTKKRHREDGDKEGVSTTVASDLSLLPVPLEPLSSNIIAPQTLQSNFTPSQAVSSANPLPSQLLTFPPETLSSNIFAPQTNIPPPSQALPSNSLPSQSPFLPPSGTLSSNIFAPQTNIPPQTLPSNSQSPSLPPQLLTLPPGALSSNIFAPQSNIPPQALPSNTLPSQSPSLPPQLLTLPPGALSSNIFAPQTVSSNLPSQAFSSNPLSSQSPLTSQWLTFPPKALSSNIFAPQTQSLSAHTPIPTFCSVSQSLSSAPQTLSSFPALSSTANPPSLTTQTLSQNISALSFAPQSLPLLPPTSLAVLSSPNLPSLTTQALSSDVFTPPSLSSDVFTPPSLPLVRPAFSPICPTSIETLSSTASLSSTSQTLSSSRGPTPSSTS